MIPKYICIEGMDGTGKSTLAKAIFDRLGYRHAELLCFPSSRGLVGSLIRDGLTGRKSIENKTFMYLFAADCQQENLRVQDILHCQKRHLICDRHPLISGRAYQRRHHSDYVVENLFSLLKQDGVSLPDNLFILDVSTEEALRRMQTRDKYVDVVFENRDVAEVDGLGRYYRNLCKMENGTLLDGEKTTEELVTEVLTLSGIL